MKKVLPFLLLMFSVQMFAQVHRSVVFDFAAPSTLTPAVTPGDVNGSVVPITDKEFTSGHVSVNFKLNDNASHGQGALLVTHYYAGESQPRYCLELPNLTTIIFSGKDGATLDSIRNPNDNYASLGALALTDRTQGYIDPNVPILCWKNNTGKELSSVSFSNSGSSSSQLTTITVYYTIPSDILVPVSSIANGSTVEKFENMTLTFSSPMTLVSEADITLSDGTKKWSLAARVDGAVVTLSTTAELADGKYTVTVPARRFKDAEGFENAALSYTFTLSSPKNIFVPETITPAQGAVESLTSPITLTFPSVVKDFGEKQLILSKDGEEYILVTAAKSNTNPKVVELTLNDVPNGITEKGTYTLTIPEGMIYQSVGKIYNPALSLQYTIGIDTPEPDPEPTEDSETMKAAKKLLQQKGLGYPSETSRSRILLQSLTEANPIVSDDKLKEAIGQFYAETDVVLPSTGKYYQIAGINASGSKAYLTYANGAVSLSASKDAATAFEADSLGAAMVFKTTDGHYLHVLTAENSKYQGTSSKNVTAERGSVNELQLEKLTVDGVDASATFGLFSLYGSLGTDKILGQKQGAYALVGYEPNLTVATSYGYPLMFETANSSAFVLYEVGKPNEKEDTVVVTGDFDYSYYEYKLSPSNANAIRDTDLNNIVISIAKGDYSALVVDESKTVEITVYDDPYQVVLAKGHFEPYTIPESPSRPAIRLVLDTPIATGSLSNNKYGVKLPKATFGDYNFGLYLKDKSVKASSCKVNPEWAIPYNVNNDATGIDDFTAQDAAAMVIYDLAGRRLERIARPGIYIVNGRKMVVK